MVLIIVKLLMVKLLIITIVIIIIIIIVIYIIKCISNTATKFIEVICNCICILRSLVSMQKPLNANNC